MATSRKEAIVITGIGLVAANGYGREQVWEETLTNRTAIRSVSDADFPFRHALKLAAKFDVELEYPEQSKVIRMARLAGDEAMFDAGVDVQEMDPARFACAISAHVGDIRWWTKEAPFVAEQWLPNSACVDLATRFGLMGPRYSHATACASGLVELLSAVRAIQYGQCDIALAGSVSAISPVLAAGFHRMRVLANGSDPDSSCLPFDQRRHGFVMGEGAGMFVVERLEHALARGATIYAEVASGKMLADAHHVTSLNGDTEAIERLIGDSLRAAELSGKDIGYINAHGTGTEQNDLLESLGIRRSFGVAADDISVSSLKSTLGHLVNAAASVELGLTVLAMRDGKAPATLNLQKPDPACDLDFVRNSCRPNRFQHAMKLALAFGGHFVSVVVRRWNNADSGFAYPEERIPQPARARAA